jgi:hypothetical protein
MKILVCGDREWKSRETILNKLKKYGKDTIVVHGDCRGADRIGASVAEELFTKKPLAYPAQWDKYGKAAGPKRNQQMLDENPDIRVVLAFHNNIKESKGTKDMIRRASKVPGIIVSLITERGGSATMLSGETE